MEKTAGVEFQLPVGMGEVMTGTTIMAMALADGQGVALAADSRTSTGTYVASKVTDKLTKITDNIYACRSGSAADTQAIIEIVQYYLRVHEIETGETPLVSTAARLVSKLIYEYKDSFLASIIIAGWDPKNGGQVYAIPLGGTVVQEPWAIGGSGSGFIYGFCREHMSSDMDAGQAVDTLRRAIGHAVHFDGSSGGVCRTAVISQNGVAREVFDLDAKQVIQ